MLVAYTKPVSESSSWPFPQADHPILLCTASTIPVVYLEIGPIYPVSRESSRHFVLTVASYALFRHARSLRLIQNSITVWH